MNNKVMLMKKILTVAIAIWVALPLFFTGCSSPPLSDEQKGWIAKLQENYPDDDFVYQGHYGWEFGATDPNTIIVKSKLFGTFRVWKNGEQLVSEYPCMYHKKAVENYYSKSISPYFGCDDIEGMYFEREAKPIDYLNHEEYIKKYTAPKLYVILYYEEDHEYPEEDKVVKAILKYLVSVKDQKVQIHFYFCRPNVSKPTENSDEHYYVHYKDGTIIYFTNYAYDYAERPEIFSGPLEEALSKYSIDK